MAYANTITGIANLALVKIGADMIDNIADAGSVNALRANTVWNYILAEVLQERDWVFAKTRVALTQSTITPQYAYQYAYPLPVDFLRLVKPKQPLTKGINPIAYPSGLGYAFLDTSGYSNYTIFDAPVYPPGFPYVIETVYDTSASPATYDLCILTDYNNASYPLYINYIRLETDPTKYFPGFVNALSLRLAAELAIAITENMTKFKNMMEIYQMCLKQADAMNQSLDSVENEAGSQAWQNAGR